MWEAAGAFLAEHRWWFAIGLFLLAAGWEVARPERGHGGATGPHGLNHLALGGAGVLLASAAIAPWLGTLHGARPGGPFALVEQVGGGPLVLVLGLLLLDVAVYASHRLQHAVPLLWRFHAVHHADARMDASTALRHHPMLAAVEGAALGVLLGLAGLPLWVWAIYAVIWHASNFFTHADARLPGRLDAVLSRLLVTPRLHRLHHSADPAHNDRNYGAVLSVWDRLFGTALSVTEDAQRRLAFGLPGGRGARWHEAWTLPFRRRRQE
jgi:sterol desaturase/sphingolipid hydroxylase (fatty acid hydroxylase superfamily)